MTAKRKNISKKVRFEVFKRDSFTCQYCGSKPTDDAVLHIDHIHPVSKGGSNDIINLVTSCEGCNLGKGARELSDKSIIKAQADEISRQQEKLEQLKLMHTASMAMISEIDQAVDSMCELWEEMSNGWELNSVGRSILKKQIKKHGYKEVSTALEKSLDCYGKLDDSGFESYTKESIDTAIKKLAGVCRMQAADKKTPGASRLPYIVAIAKNRFTYHDRTGAFDVLNWALECGVDVEDLETSAKLSRNWSSWKSAVCELVTRQKHG